MTRTASSLKAESFLSKSKPITISITALASEALSVMEKSKITKIFVLDLEGNLAGLLDLNALLAAKNRLIML